MGVPSSGFFLAFLFLPSTKELLLAVFISSIICRKNPTPVSTFVYAFGSGIL